MHRNMFVKGERRGRKWEEKGTESGGGSGGMSNPSRTKILAPALAMWNTAVPTQTFSYRSVNKIVATLFCKADRFIWRNSNGSNMDMAEFMVLSSWCSTVIARVHTVHSMNTDRPLDQARRTKPRSPI